MNQLLYMVKIIGLTFLVVFLFQFRIGDETLEQKSYSFLTKSEASIQLRGVARGAIKLGTDGYNKVKAYAESLLSEGL